MFSKNNLNYLLSNFAKPNHCQKNGNEEVGRVDDLLFKQIIIVT
jgi:hypothetical protein